MRKEDNSLIDRLIIRFAATFVLINLLDVTAALIDGLIVSRNLGAAAMAAVGISSSFFAIMTLFCGVISAGTQVLCSNALCHGDGEGNRQIFSGSFMVIAAAAVLLTAGCLMFAEPVGMLLGAPRSEPQMFAMVKAYLTGVFTGIPGYMFFMFLTSFAALDGNRKNIIAAAIVQNACNLAGDVLTVSVFHSGLAGIGLFTGVSWNLAVLVLAAGFFRKQSLFKVKWQKINFKTLRKVLFIGSPRLARSMSKILSKLFMNRIIIFFGGMSAMAAISVNRSLTGLFLVVGLGMADCVKVLAQLIYSERDRDYLAVMMNRVLRILWIVSSAFAVLIIVFSRAVAGAFVVNDPEGLHLTMISVIALAASIPLNGTCCVLIEYLQGTGMIMRANAAVVVHRLICPLGTMLILGYFYGVMGIFIAIPAAELAALLIYAVFALLKGRKDTAITEKILLLPDDFGSGIAASFSMSANSMEEVISISQRVGTFLRENGSFSGRTVYIASLCVEEMAGNIVEHGFCLDNKTHSCDIRVIIDKDGRISLRIRDDCPLFDIRAKYEDIRDSEVYENIGIRMIYGMTDKISYVSTLHLNNLYIQI